jgi:hypothetical protein
MDEEYEYQVDQINYMDVKTEYTPILSEYYDPLIKTRPRVPRNFPILVKEKKKWNFHNSIFN